VVAKPASGLSTPAVYGDWHPDRPASELAPLRDALRAGRPDVAARYLQNDLQRPAERLNCDVVRLACLFGQQPVWGHQLSGSGTAYFGVCRSRRQGLAIAARLRSRGVPWVTVVQSRC
jgi:4-diphosphocytidyl-2-C-methyl-D-erythritol kinase